jgi:hypothetical protein
MAQRNTWPRDRYTGPGVAYTRAPEVVCTLDRVAVPLPDRAGACIRGPGAGCTRGRVVDSPPFPAADVIQVLAPTLTIVTSHPGTHYCVTCERTTDTTCYGY